MYVLNRTLVAAPGKKKRQRRTVKALHVRFKRFLVLRLLSIVSLCVVWWCLLTWRAPAASKRIRYSGQATWMSEQSISFSKRWKHHKHRNVVVYVCLSTRKIFIIRSLVRYLLSCPPVFYKRRYEGLFNVPDYCFSHTCLHSFGKSHYVYAEFVLQTFDAITTQNLSPAVPSVDGKIAVLVEPREHPLLEYTIKQVMLTLGPGWSLQLFLSSANEKRVRDCLQIRSGGIGENIVVTPLSYFGLDEMSKYGNRVQSAFSAHERMYAEIKGEHILWFQVDVVMRSQVEPEWLKYAYVGAEWPGCEYPTCSPVTCTKICGGGNSGLSLRRKSKLLQVATRGKLPANLWGYEGLSSGDLRNQFRVSDQHTGHFASDELHNNSETRWFEDDLQISYKLWKLDLLPPAEIPSRFAIDQALPKSGSCHAYSATPAGMHKPWLTPLIAPEIIMELLQMPYERAIY